MDILMFLIGGVIALGGVALGAWGVLAVQRFTLNHSVNQTLARTEPLVSNEMKEWRGEQSVESLIAVGEAMILEPKRRRE